MSRRRSSRSVRTKRKGRHTRKGSRAHFLRRNDEKWAQQHPGADGWMLTPPLHGGTRVGQDIFIARTKPAENGYRGMEVMYALFATKAKALRGNPEDTLATYHDPAGALIAEARYGDAYRFHRLVPLRGNGIRTPVTLRSRRGNAR